MKDPRKMIVVGMFASAISTVWPRFFHLGAKLNVDVVDGIRGLFLGIGFGLMIVGISLTARRSSHRPG